MQESFSEVEKRILEDLQVGAEHGKTGHYGVYPLEVLMRTLRVTLHVSPEEIESVLNSLCQRGLVERGIHVEDKEMVVR